MNEFSLNKNEVSRRAFPLHLMRSENVFGMRSTISSVFRLLLTVSFEIMMRLDFASKVMQLIAKKVYSIEKYEFKGLYSALIEFEDNCIVILLIVMHGDNRCCCCVRARFAPPRIF